MMTNLLGCCVDKNMLKEHGIEYLKGNKPLVMDVLALIDTVKVLLQVQLGVNLKSLDQAASLRPSQLEFEEQYDEIAKVLSKNLTDKSYTEVASVMNNKLSVIIPPSSNAEPRSTIKFVKSKYMLSQQPNCNYRSMLEEVVVIKGDQPLLPGTQKKKPSSLTTTERKRKVANITTTLTDCKNDHEKKLPSVKFEASKLTLATVQEKMKKEPVLGAKLKGNFTSHLESIMKKHKQVNMHYADDVFTLCAFDGAMMRTGSHKLVNMITYSTCIFSKVLQDAGFTTANSSIILTWQQVHGQETNTIVHASVKDHYEEKAEAYKNMKDIFGEKCTYYPYDCHDLKMLYCLVGKVNWNNQFGSNLLCGCNKRQGVVNNNNHKCVLMTDKEHRILYSRAGAYYQQLINKGEEVNLARDNTNKWAATDNQGINGKYFYVGVHILSILLLYYY